MNLMISLIIENIIIINRKWKLYTPVSLKKLVEKGDYYDAAE